MTNHAAMNCRLVRTSREAYAVIRAAHPEMEVFGSYSRDGDAVGHPWTRLPHGYVLVDMGS